MKAALVLTALLFSNFALANSGPLDGKSYCRMVLADGSFGQTKGERQHCISFASGMATDDANTFFGNPPETAEYQVIAHEVTFGSSEYILSPDALTLTTIKGSAAEGTDLKLRN